MVKQLKHSVQIFNKSYKPIELSEWKGVSKVMETINSSHDMNLNSCLIVRYSTDDQALTLHQDNEAIIDNSHPIVITTIGSSRTLEFWDSKSDSSGTLIKQLTPNEGDLVIMGVGCQEKLWHRVLRKNVSPSEKGSIRYAISFRRITPSAPAPKDKDPKTSTPKPAVVRTLTNGFKVHESRALGSASVASTTQEHVSPSSLSSQCDNNEDSGPKHLLLGDSLVKGLKVSGSVNICKGGIRPDEVLPLLTGSTDVISPDQYDGVKTVTLIVGTNALNIPRPGTGMPLLDVIEDYEKLVYDLKKLFPNARLGLFNVIPRVYTCEETKHRIKLFNNIFDNHVVSRIKNVCWIRLYWEFLDERGYLRDDLYGKLGIHLKGKGKALMAKSIKCFQRAY